MFYIVFTERRADRVRVRVADTGWINTGPTTQSGVELHCISDSTMGEGEYHYLTSYRIVKLSKTHILC